MIGNQTKGKSFRGLLKYLLGKEQSSLIETNMLGQSVDELTKEFSLSRKLRPRLKKAVYHASLSLPVGEKLSDKQWKSVGKRYLREMGFKGSQFVIVKHGDTDHQHIHIVASRVRLDGSVVTDSQDYKRSENIIRLIERDYGLSQVRPSHLQERRSMSRGEMWKALRTRQPSTKMRLQSIIDEASFDKPTMTDFINRLEALDVKVIANVAKTGHISGISFMLDDVMMKGSDLGRGYTWKNLTHRKVSYEQQRDFKRTAGAQYRGKSSDVSNRTKGNRGRDSEATQQNTRRELKGQEDFRGIEESTRGEWPRIRQHSNSSNEGFFSWYRNNGKHDKNFKRIYESAKRGDREKFGKSEMEALYFPNPLRNRRSFIDRLLEENLLTPEREDQPLTSSRSQQTDSHRKRERLAESRKLDKARQKRSKNKSQKIEKKNKSRSDGIDIDF